VRRCGCASSGSIENVHYSIVVSHIIETTIFCISLSRKKRNKCLNICSTFPHNFLLNCTLLIGNLEVVCPAFPAFFAPLSLCVFALNLLPSLFAPLPLCACAKPPRRGIALNLSSSLCLRALVSLCYAFSLLSSCSRCLGGSLFAFSAAVSCIPAVQMSKLAGGGSPPVPAEMGNFSASLPRSRRRKVALQRQLPVFPPFTPAAILPFSPFLSLRLSFFAPLR
jgi:hypothetical protein